MTSGSGPAAHGRVVVGVDGSQPSARAAVYAAGEAQRRGAGLLVVHVTPWRAGADAMPMAAAEARARFADSARRLVETAADVVRAESGLADVEATVLDDHPVDGLLALSADAAVLVIGERGAGGLPGLLMGSTAGAVVQHARCPVIALPDGWSGPDDIGPVVVGVDGLPGQDDVLAVAAAEARTRATGLVVVHAWQEVAVEAALGQYGPLVDWATVEVEKRRHLADVVAPLRSGDLAVDEVVVRDRPATALLDTAAGAQLLVVGHRPRRLLARLGSTTHGVLHRAPCPVAVVPLREER